MSQTRTHGQAAAGLPRGLLQSPVTATGARAAFPKSRDKGGGTCYLTSSQVKQPARQRAREGEKQSPGPTSPPTAPAGPPCEVASGPSLPGSCQFPEAPAPAPSTVTGTECTNGPSAALQSGPSAGNTAESRRRPPSTEPQHAEPLQRLEPLQGARPPGQAARDKLKEALPRLSGRRQGHLAQGGLFSQHLGRTSNTRATDLRNRSGVCRRVSGLQGSARSTENTAETPAAGVGGEWPNPPAATQPPRSSLWARSSLCYRGLRLWAAVTRESSPLTAFTEGTCRRRTAVPDSGAEGQDPPTVCLCPCWAPSPQDAQNTNGLQSRSF